MEDIHLCLHILRLISCDGIENTADTLIEVIKRDTIHHVDDLGHVVHHDIYLIESSGTNNDVPCGFESVINTITLFFFKFYKPLYVCFIQ